MKANIIETITNDMVNSINEHGTSWLKNWVGDSAMPHNMISKKNYTGFNFLILASKHMTSGTWATLNQYKQANIRIRYDEMPNATEIIYFKMLESKTETNPNGSAKKFPLLKKYRVWNLSQSEDYIPETKEVEKFNHSLAEEYVKNTGAIINHGGNRAFYQSATDQITMPPKASFIKTTDATAEQNYYGTLFHELTHGTGHKTRCDRTLANGFGTEAYAYEELIAELGACFQSVEFGIEPLEINADHKKYIASWLKALKGDVSFIYKASAQANKAVRLIEELQVEEKVA